VPGTLVAVSSLLAGEADAVDSYEGEIAARPDGLEAWVGLSLTRRLALPSVGGDPLVDHPEIVYALHRAVRGRVGVAVVPTVLSNWIGRSFDPPRDGDLFVSLQR
jgi:hypothetical protein